MCETSITICRRLFSGCRGGQFWRMVTEGCYHGGRKKAAVLAAEAYVHRWLRTYEKCVHRFLAPSQFVRDKLIEYGWRPERIEVLPHFQKVTALTPPPPAPDAPMLYFGQLSAEKGVQDLLRAMQRLPEVRLTIAGEGPLRVDLEDLATSLVLKNLAFVGRMQGPDLDRLIADARFTVFPSHADETLGKTILESYAQGRAVVASDLGSRREFVRHEETGLLYRVGDVEQLAAAVARLRDHPQLAAEMGLAGRQLARERHSPLAHYQALMGLYERLHAATKRCAQAVTVRQSLIATGQSRDCA